MKDRATRARIKREIIRLIREERGGGDPKNVVLARCDWDTSLAGQNLADVTRLQKMAPTIPNAAEAVLWIVDQGGCQGIFHAISEADLERILRHPANMCQFSFRTDPFFSSRIDPPGRKKRVV